MNLNMGEIYLYLALVVFFVSQISCDGIPRTGREFRERHPEFQRTAEIHKSALPNAGIVKNPFSILQLSRLRASPRLLRRWILPRRRILHHRRRAVLEEIPGVRHYFQLNNRSETSYFSRQSRSGSNRRERPITKSARRYHRPVTSRQLQYLANKCKSIRKGNCCRGWTKHPLTGYCMPSCSKSCVHGKCQNDYVCICDAGFSGQLCNIDVNECVNDVCQQGCLNTYGSYKCVCNAGYTVARNGVCEKTHPCKAKKCQYKCYSDGKHAKCACPKGYKVAADGTSCIDVNECLERKFKCISKDERTSCRNLPGSYACTCKEGYYYHRFFKKCYDSNECLLETHNCNVSIAKCVNTEGSFRCECRENSVRVGVECRVSKNAEQPCDENFRRTVDEDGRKTRCVCNDGFTPNGVACSRGAETNDDGETL